MARPSKLSRRFRALLEAAGLASAHALAVALELDLDIARSYYEGSAVPPRVVVLAIERVVDVQLAEQITAEIRRTPSR